MRETLRFLRRVDISFFMGVNSSQGVRPQPWSVKLLAEQRLGVLTEYCFLGIRG
jgi:hypothetical protein